jgi:ribosome biogenesis GTPase
MDPDVPLETIGWTDAVEARWHDGRTNGLEPARVARTDRGIITIWPQRGTRLRATTTTAAKDVVAGDWVGYAPDERRVERVLPRATEFERQGARGARGTQTLAANMDIVLLVEAAHPKVNERRLERALVLAYQSGAEPVVIITKIDLIEPSDVEGVLADAAHTAVGATVLGLSNRTGVGVDAVRAIVQENMTVAALGASGVGKSSLVNALSGVEVQLTADVRKGDSKGKHTTTAARLIDLEGFLYIDTPGVRALALCGDGTGLDITFPEITEAAMGCQFSDCSHRSEPGCAVRAAVDAGTIRRDRFDSYQLLVDEILENDPEASPD